MIKEPNVRKRPLKIKKVGGAIEFPEAEVETNVKKNKPYEFQDELQVSLNQQGYQRMTKR